MFVVMREGVSDEELSWARSIATDSGGLAQYCDIGGRKVMRLPGCDPETAASISALAAVERVLDPPAGAPLASHELVGTASTVTVAGIGVGAGDFTVIAGPCAVEGPTQLRRSAAAVRSAGAVVLRGGAYKPRTSPHSFQGLGADGLRMLAEVSGESGLPVVTEVLDCDTIPEIADAADILQIGTRNAQNFALLREVGATRMPVLLKRGFGCTIDEWLQAAEYVLREGNDQVILCERGIRTFERRTRFTLDLSAVPVVKRLSHLPVIVDPSHAGGHRYLTRPLALAAAAVGADGVIIDVHPEPEAARCDGDQALDFAAFDALMADMRGVLASLGRRMSPAARVPAARTA